VKIFKINSSLMMPCYDIIPSWKALLCFKPWQLTPGRHFPSRDPE